MGGPQDIEWALAGDTLWVLQSRPITTAGRHLGNPPVQPSSVLLRGIGASPGCATGPVRLLHRTQDIPSVRTGDIVVCYATDPAWTPLFTEAGGVVTEQGGLLCHAAILARELALPAVVGATGALSLLTSGATVTLDGSAGTVTTTDP